MENKLPWWKDYRRRQHKPKKYMSLEIIVRKSFVLALKEYTKNTSIPGLKELCSSDIQWTQRVVHFLILMVMSSMMLYILHYTWVDTLGKPLIITMESSTYPISMIDFPAVALCNVNRISKKALKELAVYLHGQIAHHNETLEEVEEYCLEMGRLLDYSYNESAKNYATLKMSARKQYKTRTVIDFMRTMAPRCDEMLLKCSWGGETVDCRSIFAVRRTVKGHCCAFNYVLNYDLAGRPNSTMAEVRRQLVPGLYHGLSILLDPMVHDYAYPLHSIQGFDIFLFDPAHFADPSGGRVIHRIVEPNHAEYFGLKSVKQRASAEVRKYPFKTRKCLFHDEMPQDFGEMYSYSACLVNCRMNSMRSLCKCTPFYMPLANYERVCTIDDLRCLNKYKEKLMYIYPMDAIDTQGLEWEIQDSLYCPDCLPDCELTRHSTKTFQTALVIEDVDKNNEFRYSFVQGKNLTNKCFLSIYQSTSDGILERLDVVAYWFEILSNLGGFGGILVSFSIICVAELFYFLIIHFVKLTIINYNNYN